MVPGDLSAGTPCSSPATMKAARIGSTAPFMVIETHILSSGMPVEQDLHVLDAVDGDARLADIADDARMIGIVAAMGGEIEGDREPHLARREIVAVEGVGFLGGREAGILPDGPRPAGIHGRARAAEKGGKPGRLSRSEPLQIGGRVERLDVDALGRVPIEAVTGFPASSRSARAAQSARVFLSASLTIPLRLRPNRSLSWGTKRV